MLNLQADLISLLAVNQKTNLREATAGSSLAVVHGMGTITSCKLPIEYSHIRGFCGKKV